MLTVTQIAWAAGIYEGEGTFSGGRSVRVVQKDSWLIYRIAKLFGGTVSTERGYYTWTVTGERARGFLLTIFSFLSPRRRKQILEYPKFFKDENFKNHLNVCDKGHELTDRNTQWQYSSTHAWRQCRICLRVKQKKRTRARRLGISFGELTKMENQNV